MYIYIYIYNVCMYVYICKIKAKTTNILKCIKTLYFNKVLMHFKILVVFARILYIYLHLCKATNLYRLFTIIFYLKNYIYIYLHICIIYVYISMYIYIYIYIYLYIIYIYNIYIYIYIHIYIIYINVKWIIANSRKVLNVLIWSGHK